MATGSTNKTKSSLSISLEKSVSLGTANQRTPVMETDPLPDGLEFSHLHQGLLPHLFNDLVAPTHRA
jgi:hypothetical protein